MTSETKEENSVQSGTITLYVGPMFSGKTSTMLTAIERKAYGFPCVIIKYIKDTRYGTADEIKSHNTRVISSRPRNEMGESIRIIVVGKLSDVVLHEAENNIGIDEGQFFPDLNEQSNIWADAGKHVIIAALNGTFERKMFSTVSSLIPNCIKIEKLTAVCMFCHRRDAHWTKRTIRVAGDKEEFIGGTESYKACCRVCWDKVGI